MRRVLASLGFGVLLCALWVCLIVVTSQDFAHEGPNSSLAVPILWWGSVIQWSGVGRFIRSFGPTGDLVLAFSSLFAPFVCLFSVLSYFLLRSVTRRRQRSMP